MTLQQKKSRELEQALKTYDWFRCEMAQYVKDGDLAREQADVMLEDMAEQLGL
mgnify:CR=1 FL=1